jgi:lysophospholipase L1-like esterase
VVNDYLKRLDAPGAGVRFIDIGRRFLESDGRISARVMPDFLHLSHRGYEIWGEAIRPVLAEMVSSGALRADARTAPGWRLGGA